jgi:hypothetical protein
MLGRIYVDDVNDYDYPIVFNANTVNSDKTESYWDQDLWWGNQGNTPKCVGFSWRHWLMDGPVPQSNKAMWAVRIYNQAHKIDGIVGKHDGTTIRAGAKVLKKAGYISEYRWAWSIDPVIQTLLHKSPVVVGTTWYSDMYSPSKEGILKVSGRKEGGHAYLLNGIDLDRGLIRVKNSWGKAWGLNGNAWISIEDMDMLIKERGEVCLATEVSKRN